LRPKTLGLCLSLLAAASGCDGPARPAPAVVRFSALPDQTPDRVLTQHKAVVEEVCRIARVSCAWVPAPSYHGLVAAFGRGEIDVAFSAASPSRRRATASARCPWPCGTSTSRSPA
jgi:ABC-type phosphate/phosphonate transport system substrate-binding protein